MVTIHYHEHMIMINECKAEEEAHSYDRDQRMHDYYMVTILNARFYERTIT